MTETPAAQQARILWQIAFDAEVTVAPLALADGVLFATGRAGLHQLRRTSLDGETRWSLELPARPVGPPVRSGKLVAIGLEDGRVVAADVDSGKTPTRAWASLDQPLLAPLAAYGGRVHVRVGAGGGAALIALAPGAEAPVWRVPDPSGGGARVLMKMSGGVLIFAGGTIDGSAVMACGYDASGKVLWTHREVDCELNDLWAVGGIVDLVTTRHVVGLDARTGAVRTTRFTSFPLGDARATGSCLVAMMEGHMGPVLLSFDLLSQRLVGRVSRAMTRLVGAHPAEALVTLVNGEPAIFALPTLESVGLPEASAIGAARSVAWSRNVCYLVADHGRALTAIDLDVLGR